MKFKDNILKTIMLSGALCMSVAGLIMSIGRIAPSTKNQTNISSNQTNNTSRAFTGRGNPSTTEGKDGDSYIDLNTMDIYFKQNGQNRCCCCYYNLSRSRIQKVFKKN